MTLQEFLLTASEDNAQALIEARQYTTGEGKLIPATTVNQIFAEHDLTGVIKDTSEDPNHIARHKLLSVLLSIQGDHEFNFIQGTTAGNGNLLMLDWLINVAMTEHAAKLTAFKNTMLFLSNKQVQPFANVTLYDIAYIRGNVPTKLLTPEGRYVTITTTADCEKHNASVYGFNPRTHNWQSIQAFRGVEKAGTYDAEIPSFAFGWSLRVDDCYEVM